MTDIRMPGMSGLKTLEALREVTEYAKKSPVPEIILTAFNDKHVVEEAMRMGVHEFLLKPFDVDTLIEIVRKYL